MMALSCRASAARDSLHRNHPGGAHVACVPRLQQRARLFTICVFQILYDPRICTATADSALTLFEQGRRVTRCGQCQGQRKHETNLLLILKVFATVTLVLRGITSVSVGRGPPRVQNATGNAQAAM
jgi:hypothetical protein